ncbi:hypothetical protein E4H12_02515 [Candidatus Thorarchaeota archaeon]|nr:MAG: hypothetical protein E4H12_02515 [Candidatus Thorarchaeota archaeon]
MTVVKGVVREVGKSRTTRVSAQRWYGSTEIVIQDESTKKTYTVRISANTMDKCRFLPRVGVPVIVHGYVEEDEYGLSDFMITRVTDIKREGEGIKRVYKLD